MTFTETWARVGSGEGEAFRTDQGAEFSYRFKKTFVVIAPGGQSIPRTNFEKVFRGSDAPVQGHKLIVAILGDSRVAG